MDIVEDEVDELCCGDTLVRVEVLHDVPWHPTLLCVRDEPHALLVRGSIHALPLWLAAALVAASAARVLPGQRAFSTRTRADLLAGASDVTLRDLAPHWYRLGLRLAPHCPHEALPAVLSAALARRLPHILAMAEGVPLDRGSAGDADPHATIFGGGGAERRLFARLDPLERPIAAAALASFDDSERAISAHL